MPAAKINAENAVLMLQQLLLLRSSVFTKHLGLQCVLRAHKLV